MEIDQLEATLSRRERRVLVRTTLLTFIPVVLAAVLLWVTIDRVRTADRKLDRVKVELADASRERDAAQREVARLQAQLRRDRARLRSVQAQLRESSNFVGSTHPVDFTDVKLLASRRETAARILLLIERLRGVRWGFANTPEKGFVSPGFAGYVLQGLGRLPKSLDPQQALFRLPRSSERPFIGDVVLYETGFAMFYLRDAEGRPFVMGMTPVGVLALEVRFGPRETGVLRTGLSREE